MVWKIGELYDVCVIFSLLSLKKWMRRTLERLSMVNPAINLAK